MESLSLSASPRVWDRHHTSWNVIFQHIIACFTPPIYFEYALEKSEPTRVSAKFHVFFFLFLFHFYFSFLFLFLHFPSSQLPRKLFLYLHRRKNAHQDRKKSMESNIYMFFCRALSFFIPCCLSS